uniref:hypothetical protein n=1 Tax=Cupriavidus yeoncheonensis TaxID=1462994 RepID=UPI003F495D67
MTFKRVLAAIVFTAASEASFGFNLTLGSSEQLPDSERHWASSWAAAVINLYKGPVHEEITLASLNCSAAKDCQTGLESEGIMVDAIMDGIRWNDNPTFEITMGPGCRNQKIKLGKNELGCWLASMARAEAAAGKKPRSGEWPFSLVARSHFRDMQFLHSMASIQDKSHQATADQILMWAEFFYRASMGEWKLMTKLEDLPNFARFRRPFRGTGWTVGMLVDYEWKNAPRARGIALGSLLHMVQDSFAGCHVVRRTVQYKDGAYASEIDAFLRFEEQSSHKHSIEDASDQWRRDFADGRPNPVSFGQALLSYRRAGAAWKEGPEALVRSYYVLSDAAKTTNTTRQAAKSRCNREPEESRDYGKGA